jgi:hypothetical protein
MPTKQKLGLYAAVSNYQSARVFNYCSNTNKGTNIKNCYNIFLQPDGGTCYCGCEICLDGSYCMNTLGIQAYNFYSPDVAYQVEFGYCQAICSTSDNAKYCYNANSAALQVLLWYYNLWNSADDLVYYINDNLNSSEPNQGLPTGWYNITNGDFTKFCYINQASFSNCYINVFNPGSNESIAMSPYLAVGCDVSYASGPYKNTQYNCPPSS